jgi:hypothetical protein
MRDSNMSNSEKRAVINWFDLIRILVLIAGLYLSGCQMNNQHATMPPNQDIGSTNDLLRISRELDKPKYAGIVSAIDYHAGDYPIRSTVSHKRFSDNLLREYLGNLEIVGALVRDKTVSTGRAYEELGFDIEKTWCNHDVREFIDDSRKADNQSSDAKNSYSAFEEFAKYCLAKDNKTCADMDKAQIVEQQ